MSCASQFGQDVFLDSVVFEGRRGGLFLDLGGFDGVAGSNTLFFERERGWSGWLLEPDPALWRQAQHNRRCECLQVAAASADGRQEFWRPTNPARRMMGGLASSMREEYVDAMRAERGHCEEVIEVATISMSTFLSTRDIREIDLVSMDIEGAEREVLASFPFERVRVDAWTIENLEGTADLQAFMARRGYELVRRLGVDEVYVPAEAAGGVRQRNTTPPFDEAVDLLDAGFFAHADAAFDSLCMAKPDDAFSWNNLGLARRQLGDAEGALEAHRRAFALDPNCAAHRRNLQRLLVDLYRPDEAIELAAGVEEPSDLDRAVNEQGKFEIAYAQGDIVAAVAAATRWQKVSGDSATSYLAEAEALLSDRQLRPGWASYEHRTHVHAAVEVLSEHSRWKGEDLREQRLLVVGEQGFGDQVFFARFLCGLVGEAAEVTVAVPTALRRLFAASGFTTISSDDIDPDHFDLWTPIGSIPHHTTSDSIVAPWAIEVPAAATERARGRLLARTMGVRRAGIVWSGRADTARDRARHLRLDALRPVFDIPEVDWYSLAKGTAAEDIAACGLEETIIAVGSDDADLADMAAVCRELDLVVTVCTVTAHLAASLGVPTYVLLHHRPFWVWGHHATTSPWYPSARLIRQQVPGDWDPVVGRLVKVLTDG